MKMQNSIVDSDCVRGLELGLFVLKLLIFLIFYHSNKRNNETV